jgi:hypothetical protein
MKPKKTREEIFEVINSKKDKKLVRKSEYKHVSIFTYSGFIYYKAQIKKLKFASFFLVEKDAAKAVDLKLIENGITPINILKPI